MMILPLLEPKEIDMDRHFANRTAYHCFLEEKPDFGGLKLVLLMSGGYALTFAIVTLIGWCVS